MQTATLYRFISIDKNIKVSFYSNTLNIHKSFRHEDCLILHSILYFNQNWKIEYVTNMHANSLTSLLEPSYV